MARMRFRPSKEKAIFSMIAGFIMVGLGIFVVIPTFGAFGVFWTLMALAIGCYHAYIAFSDRGGDSEIHFDGLDGFGQQNFNQPPRSFPEEDDAESRLKKLESLKIKNLISDEEYQEKRKQILRDL